MNIQYPVSEILRCVDYINDPKKEIYESSNEILVLNNPLTMKKETKETKEKERTKPLVLKENDILFNIKENKWDLDLLKLFNIPENILPKVQGWKSVFSCLNNARYGIAWGVMGAAQTAWLIAKDYSENRIMFKKPLASKQLIQKKLALMQTEITLGWSACLHAGRAMEKNKDVKVAISMLKRNNCQKAIEVVREARDMLGANGLLEEYHIMRHLVNLETVKTYEGAEDIHSLILGKFQTNIDAF